jgi:hypothetical protein
MNSLILLGGFDDALKLLRALGPGERMTSLVIVSEEVLQEFLEIVLRTLHTVRQPLLAKNTDEAFDEIQPGGMGRSVVKPNPRMMSAALVSKSGSLETT